MKNPKILFLFLTIFLGLFAAAQDQRPPVTVAVSGDATALELLAARDLTNILARLYPSETFRLTNGSSLPARSIRMRTAKSGEFPPEAFFVSTFGAGDAWTAEILGSDPRGATRGVYALLERLGCGFFLSDDTLPPPRPGPFSVKGCEMQDHPLVRDRLVFDWHNFLSGCSTWNLPQWESWIRQSQKIGYNAIMVHAYGNNPMVSFKFNGRQKPLGFLSTTVKGRDWSTMHVNDVRRLWGGEVFDRPAFGADAALVSDDQRAGAAQALMQQVFASAADGAMDVYFADDVDTVSANPQALIETLPPDARFTTSGKDGTLWLANPETPEGYRYYKTQVESLLATYPQISCLVVWFRRGSTPWTDLKISEMPLAWQQEYAAEIARTPKVAGLWRAPQMFAIGKIVRAFDRALKETGNSRVQLASGTWTFDFLPSCDRFFPPHVKLIGLDYNVLHDRPQLGDAESRKVILNVAVHRPVIPVIWAQHDDGNYIGRPYTPFADFYTKLAGTKTAGFGIIHWTTRPLDLFFTSHIRQVWQRTQNESLPATCDDMAAKSFGASAGSQMGRYLLRWVTDAPKFARETSDYFIDRPLTNVSEVVAGCRDRLKLVDAVDRNKLSLEGQDRLNYFKGLEEFILAFFQTQELFQRSQAELKEGRMAQARALMQQCRPEPVIEQFAKFSSLGGITRGEQGLIVSLNLRWLTHIIRHRQALRLEPVNFSFGPTSHDPLAQSAGKFTFDVTTNRVFWERWGEKETGAATWTLPTATPLELDGKIPGAWAEIVRSGIEFDQPMKLSLHPIMREDGRGRGKPASLPPGEYLVRLLFADPSPTGAARRVFDVQVTASVASGAPVQQRVDLSALAGGPGRVLERVYPTTLRSSGVLEIRLTPVTGKAVLCGAVVEPRQ